MPNDGGVDVVSGACAPPPPKPKPKPVKKPRKGERPTKKGTHATRKGDDLSDGALGESEDCTTERTLIVKPGSCTWFLVEIRGKRLTPPQRKAVGEKLKKLVGNYCRKVPAHTEEE